MAKKWDELRYQRPLDPEKVESLRRSFEREYGRPRWRIVRLWDRLIKRFR